jgi:hypothetical protein
MAIRMPSHTLHPTLRAALASAKQATTALAAAAAQQYVVLRVRSSPARLGIVPQLPFFSCFKPLVNLFAAIMLAKLLNPPSVVKAESRMTQLHAVEKASPWAAKFGWFNHGRCQKTMALRGMKDNVRAAYFHPPPLPPHSSLRGAAHDTFVSCFVIQRILILSPCDFFYEHALFE